MFVGMDGVFINSNDSNNTYCGGKHESYIDGLNNEIKSTDIIEFKYTGTDYSVSAVKDDNLIHISAIGGGKYNRRDGSYFSVRFDINDDGFFDVLQGIITRYSIFNNNGYCLYIDGLPGGIGDTIEINYSSGERIYKTSNQSVTISYDAIKEIYDVFHEITVKNGLDFNTAGSNIKLFDDADEEYVQGNWKGKHFGKEVEVTFKGKKLTIKVDGNITDEDEEYIIKDGFIRKNKLSDGKTGEKYTDYEEFNGVSSFAKKNYFTMTGYFTKESYSTCDLMNFDKEKPESK